MNKITVHTSTDYFTINFSEIRRTITKGDNLEKRKETGENTDEIEKYDKGKGRRREMFHKKYVHVVVTAKDLKR
jgi:hypothetical protein